MVELKLSGVDGFLDVLGVRHLLSGVTDEQRHRADDHRCRPDDG